MARGTLYEITGLVENLFAKDEAWFYDLCGHEFEYISQEDREEAEESVRTLISRMKEEGAETGTERIPASEIPNYDGDEDFLDVTWFEVTPEVRKNYFLPQFKRVKALAENMTFDDFVKGVRTWDLREAVEEHYGDAVSLDDDSFIAFDAFMRNAEGRFYIGNTFFMN